MLQGAGEISFEDVKIIEVFDDVRNVAADCVCRQRDAGRQGADDPPGGVRPPVSVDTTEEQVSQSHLIVGVERE